MRLFINAWLSSSSSKWRISKNTNHFFSLLCIDIPYITMVFWFNGSGSVSVSSIWVCILFQFALAFNLLALSFEMFVCFPSSRHCCLLLTFIVNKIESLALFCSKEIRIRLALKKKSSQCNWSQRHALNLFCAGVLFYYFQLCA